MGAQQSRDPCHRNQGNIFCFCHRCLIPYIWSRHLDHLDPLTRQEIIFRGWALIPEPLRSRLPLHTVIAYWRNRFPPPPDEQQQQEELRSSVDRLSLDHHGPPSGHPPRRQQARVLGSSSSSSAAANRQGVGSSAANHRRGARASAASGRLEFGASSSAANRVGQRNVSRSAARGHTELQRASSVTPPLQSWRASSPPRLHSSTTSRASPRPSLSATSSRPISPALPVVSDHFLEEPYHLVVLPHPSLPPALPSQSSSFSASETHPINTTSVSRSGSPQPGLYVDLAGPAASTSNSRSSPRRRASASGVRFEDVSSSSNGHANNLRTMSPVSPERVSTPPPTVLGASSSLPAVNVRPELQPTPTVAQERYEIPFRVRENVANIEAAVQLVLQRASRAEENRRAALLEAMNEILLELSQFYESVIIPRLTREQLDRIPCQTYARPANTQGDPIACPICICEMEDGDSFRVLPCAHIVHQQCMDMWLSQNRSCPICRCDVETGRPQEILRRRF